MNCKVLFKGLQDSFKSIAAIHSLICHGKWICRIDTQLIISDNNSIALGLVKTNYFGLNASETKLKAKSVKVDFVGQIIGHGGGGLCSKLPVL